MMLKIVSAIVLFILAHQNLSSQTITIADVLATASTDLRLKQNEDLQNFLQEIEVRDPLLRQVSGRFGVNGSALGDTIYGYLRNEDTYQLQVGFNSLLERKKQRQVKMARLEALRFESQVLHEMALVQRYESLVTYLFALPKLDACRRLDSLFNKEHQILKEMLTVGVLDVKVSKVLNAEEDRNRNYLIIQTIENLLTFELNRLRQFVGVFDDLDRNDLAKISDLRAKIAFIRSNLDTRQRAEQDLKNAEIRIEAAKLSYAEAQNRRIFNNFDLGYQRPLYLRRPNKFNTFNNISFRVRLNVPLPANNRFKKAAVLLDLRRAENDAAYIYQKNQNDVENQFLRLENLFREYDMLQDRMENSLIKKMLQNSSLRTQITPLEIVEMEIAQQRLVIQQAVLEAEIGKEYVRLLQISGVLGRNFSVNFLSKVN